MRLENSPLAAGRCDRADGTPSTPSGRRRTRAHFRHAVAIALTILAMGSGTVGVVRAGEKTVDRVEQTSTAIIVRFSIPITYLSHAPVDAGSSVQVDLRPLREAGVEAELSVKERPMMGSGGGLPLTDATYENVSNTTGRLTLTFSRRVRFVVKPGADSRSIVVTVVDAAAAVPAADVVVEAPPPNPTLNEPVPETSLPKGETAELMSQAREAMRAGDYEKAIRILTRVLEAEGNNEAKPEALEMLGLARERNKQVAHAKAEYEEYLRRYPQGEGAERVRQRLAGLLTAASKPKARLRESSRQVASGETGSETFVRGSFSQSVRRDQDVFTDEPNGGLTRFDLDSNLDTTFGYSDSDIVVSMRANGGYLYDLMGNGGKSEGRISSLYLELSDADRLVSARIGRQTRSTDGVLGRFDGGLFSAKLADVLKVNLVGGMPVDSSTDLTIKSNRYFGGVGLEIGPFLEDWSVNLYGIHQVADSMTDRSAVGGEFRYTRPDVSVFGLVDYDVFYNELNIAVLSGNYFFEDRSTFNFAVDYRTTPILTTTNALQGQTATSIQELLGLVDKPTVEQLARDRTGTTKSISIGASHPFDDNFQVSADVLVTDTSGTPASPLPLPGVAAMPAPGVEYFYGIQFTGTNLFAEGDIAALGLRYADQDQYNRTTIDLNTRFPATDLLRLNPRLRWDYRWNKLDSGNEMSLKPSMRVNYRPLEDWELEVELGGDWRKTETPTTNDELLGYFAYFTYRIDY